MAGVLLPALVVIFFMFPNGKAHTIQEDCRTQACVADLVRRAEADPNVVRYQILTPGDRRVEASGFPLVDPQQDVWLHQ